MWNLAVRWQGELYRLVADDTRGGLFNRDGLALQVFPEAGSPQYRLPVFRDAQGTEVVLRRTTKPCSCKGSPWSTSAQALMAKL